MVRQRCGTCKTPPPVPQVNGKMQTSNPDVYAVGDIAAYPLKRYNITTRQEHVKNARQTGALAVAAILAPGETQDFDYLPYFYSRVFDLGWQVGAFGARKGCVWCVR